MRSEGTLERGCKERLAPLRNTLPSSARLGKHSEALSGKYFDKRSDYDSHFFERQEQLSGKVFRENTRHVE